MKKLLSLLVFSLIFFNNHFAIADKKPMQNKIDPNQILQMVDDIRNPKDSYIMNVKIESSEDEEDSLFEVSIKGNDKTLVKTLEPKRDRGRVLLMLDENMWVFIPKLGRSVRISLSQKLSGQAANGDISRMKWSGDYNAIVENEEKDHWILLLEATKKGLTYDKIRVWVNKKNNHPSKVEYLSLSKKILKVGEYKEFKELAGRIRPTVLEIQNSLKLTDKSKITILNMEVKELQDSMFNQKNLK